ncbi:MAG TPA: hypothetical protein VF171_06365 [Trueperaceae bacterium]
MSEPPEDDRLKELIKSALREVLAERDRTLGAVLEQAGLDDGTAGLLPPDPFADVGDFEEQADELLDELADSAREFLSALEQHRDDSAPGTAANLHDSVMELEAAAQDAHDAIDDLLDVGKFEEDGGDEDLN